MNRRIIIPEHNIDEFNDYMSLKKTQSYIYRKLHDDDYNDERCANYILSYEFLENLLVIIKENKVKGFMDEEIKNNIRDILQYIRNNKKFETQTTKQKMIELLNEFLIALNISTNQCVLSNYWIEICRRRFNKDYAKVSNDNIIGYIESRKDLINESISKDYDNINGLVSTSIEEYKENIVSDKINNHFYLDTINLLFDDFLSLYGENGIIEKINFVLDINEKLKHSNYPHKDIEEELIYRTREVKRKIKKINR